jgi:hypothetical protein
LFGFCTIYFRSPYNKKCLCGFFRNKFISVEVEDGNLKGNKKRSRMKKEEREKVCCATVCCEMQSNTIKCNLNLNLSKHTKKNFSLGATLGNNLIENFVYSFFGAWKL